VGYLCTSIIGPQKPWLSSELHCGVSTITHTNSAGADAMECPHATLSDCLEPQFEMVAHVPATT
jgi:hypothetical protein